MPTRPTRLRPWRPSGPYPIRPAMVTVPAGKDSIRPRPGGSDDACNAVAGALTLAASRATGDSPVLAANVAPEPRARVLDAREFEQLRRGLY